MNEELATHISLLAAPLYAMLLAREGDSLILPERLSELRRHAITQALALWLDARKTESPSANRI